MTNTMSIPGLVCAGMVLCAVPAAHAALGCTLAANPATVTGVYSSSGNLDVQGTFSVRCTRDPSTDPRRTTLWLSLNQPTSGGTLTRDTGGSTLNYTIYRRAFGSGVWTSIPGYSANSSQTGALTDSIDFGNRGANYSGSYNFYLRVPANQLSAGAGVYPGTVQATLYQDNPLGTQLSTAVLTLLISVPKSCRFSTNPSPVSIVYPAFSATEVTGTSNFALTCTQGTTYTLALDRGNGVIPTVQLAYTAALSAIAATGNAVAQPYTVTITVPARQAGGCTGPQCTGTDSRTLTVTY